MKNPDKLNFLTAGMPLKTNPKDYKNAFNILEDMNLDGLEVEFVHGVRLSETSFQTLNKNSNKFLLTAHGPYYINLNAKEEEKVEASIKRIIDTAQVANSFGAYSITYHAAFYLGEDAKDVYKKVKERTDRITKFLKSENNSITIRPETTGKPTQWGDLDEIIALSKDCENVLPCVDFSHLHARSNGKFNTYDDFCKILEKIGNEIGQYALDNFHGHLAGIAYSEKGEKHHLELDNSDMNYKELLKALKEFNVKGALVCESPNIEEDCDIIKRYYESL